MSGAVLIYCARKQGKQALGKPLGWGWFKCSYCGATFRGIEDA